MKDSKIAIALVAGIVIGFVIRGAGRDHGSPPEYLDRDVQSYLVKQLKAAPGITKVESMRMGFDGKSLLATVTTKSGKTGYEIKYTLSNDGYYQTFGSWNFDIGSATELWPYEME